MSKYSALPGALLLVALAGSAAAATNLTLSGVNRAEFWAFRDSWATIMEDKLDLTARYGDLNASLGLFLFEPSQPWDALRKPMRLLDYTIAYSPKQFEVLYGKYFQTFGKGLALRTYKDDDFRHYKSLHGLRGIAHLPLRTDIVLLGGRLRDMFFQENTYKILNLGDTTDQVLGANLATRPLKDLKGAPALLKDIGLGGRYVRVNRSGDLSALAFTELYGADASATLGPVDVYGEFCQRQGTKPLVGGRDKGFGYYLDATLSLGSYSLLAEYMDYDRMAYPLDITPGSLGLYHFNDPPTPIKSGVAINRGSDERGFGLTATATPIAPWYIEANYGQLYTHDGKTAGVMEWEGKTRYSLGTDWTLEGKFNHSLQKNVELHVNERTVDKPSVLINWVSGQHTVAFEGEYAFVEETRDDEVLLPGPYHETVLSASYGYGANLLFTVGWQGVDRKLAKRYSSEVSWPLFETVWSITDRNVLRIRIGSEKGGYTCSGGVCRFEAPFSGVKVQLLSRF